MSYRWKPSKSKAKEFAIKMQEIEQFCADHGISASASNDSYYFTLNDKKYRVSNHTVAASNRGAALRGYMYHDQGESEFDQCITAGKTRIIEIYNNLAAGKTLDRRGNVIESED